MNLTQFQNGVVSLGAIPHRHVIKSLTDLAASLQTTHAREVVEVVTQTIHQAPPEHAVMMTGANSYGVPTV